MEVLTEHYNHFKKAIELDYEHDFIKTRLKLVLCKFCIIKMIDFIIGEIEKEKPAETHTAKAILSGTTLEVLIFNPEHFMDIKTA